MQYFFKVVCTLDSSHVQVAELLKHMAAGMEGVRVESCVGGLSTKKARHGPMQVAVGSSSKLLQASQPFCVFVQLFLFLLIRTLAIHKLSGSRWISVCLVNC